MAKPYRTYFIFLLLSVFSRIHSSNVNYSFSEFTVKNGLSHSTVTSIAEDRIGSYWIGTPDGLTRILGDEVRNYVHINDVQTSILSNIILFVAKDKRNQAWVSTNQGISRYIQSTDSFEPLKFENKAIVAFSYQLQENGILLGGLGQIFKYDYDSGEVVRIAASAKEPLMRYHYIHQAGKTKYLIVNYYKGVYWLDALTGKLSRFAEIGQDSEYSSAYIDSSSHLWLALYKKGLKCYSIEGEGKLLHHYTVENSELNNNAVMDIREHNKELWIATDGGGINVLDMKSDSFSHIVHSAHDETSIPTNFIKALYEDSYGNIWAGSVKNGLIGLRRGLMRNFASIINDNMWNSDNKSLSAICEDGKGNIWLGVEHSGLSRYDVLNNTFHHFPLKSSKSIMSIVDYDEKRLLVAIYGDGVYCLDKQTGRMVRFIVVNPEEDRLFGESSIGIRLFRTLDGRIHLYGNSIYEFNPANHRFHKIRYDCEYRPNLLNVVTSDISRTIVYDNQCIYEISNDDFSIHSVYIDPRDEIKAAAAYNDHLYLCDGQGIKMLNLTTKELTKINMPHDIKADALLCDDAGRLWIACNEAILCYFPEDGKIISLSEIDGFQPNRFFPYAILKSRLGYMYFGGSDGLLQFDETALQNKVFEEPEPFLLSAHLSGKRITGKASDGIERFSFPWNYSSASFHVYIKEQDIFRKKSVRYIIHNDQYNSVIDKASTRLFLPTLNPGNYSISVSCYSKEGIWTKPKALVLLTVLPPWWKTWWSSMIAALFVMALIVSFIMFLLYNRKRKLQEFLNVEKGKFAEEKVNFLINMSHELRTPLTLIYAPLKRLFECQKDKGLQEQLYKILLQVENMTQLINGILDVRKMEMGNALLQITNSNLNDWVRDVAENFRDEMKIKHISLKYDFSDKIGTANFDKEKCRIILSNFLMNALKYSDSEGVVLVKTSLEHSAGFIRISVEDQGVGLSEVDRSKLFDPFYQGNHAAKGNGIGLPYSKLLVEMQGGTIGFFANQTSGTTFYFELPANLKCDNIKCEKGEYLNQLINTSTGISLNSSPNFTFNKYSVLLVDDAIDFLDYMKHSFKPYFKKIYTSPDGETALSVIKSEHPDIIISDVMMPGMDGFKLCKTIKTDLEISHIPVVLLTAIQEIEGILTGYKMGADAYVPKPFDTSFLLTIIKNQLCMREAIKKHIMEVNIVEIPCKCTFSNADELFLIKLNDFIKEHMDNPTLDLNMINRHMCMSHSSLYTKIKALTGYSANDYVNHVRLSKAKEYLISTDKKITEIATLVGFGDSRYFSTAFKRVMGMSPTQFKEKHRTK